ncbi:MAG: hypothetical protein RL531_22 [Actinomycetota bacterium]|jgi:EmrB/QacA subfamily drug resistance transporter
MTNSPSGHLTDDTPAPGLRSRWLVLAVVCVATYSVLLDGSTVNIALPTFVKELGATTTGLKWIVDAYNLAFAAFVLVFGTLADRYGRRPALIAGLGVFIAGNVGAALAGGVASLVAMRALSGIGAAIVFPTTLSIISDAFRDRSERAKAIGIWGAMTGLGVATGPIVGGWLLERFAWPSIFWLMVPISAVALLLTIAVVHNSRDPQAPPIDTVGLAVSVLALGSLVTAIIQAPDWGWLAPPTLGLFGIAIVTAVAFVRWERGREHPMLDVRLFRNPRFSAASGSITVAFFALFGFIFLITQYMQSVRGYSPLAAGVRTLPVAFAVGTASVLGTRAAVRFGNRRVVGLGLLSLSLGFVWISFLTIDTPYLMIVGQMFLLGGGIGLTTAPATEAIMGEVPADRAGQGSAVNDATREIGGTLGVAVIGSVYASVYTSTLLGRAEWRAVPAEYRDIAEQSIGAALEVAERAASIIGPRGADLLALQARLAFVDALAIGCYVAAGVTILGSLAAFLLLPDHPTNQPEA